jgi:hypothetical protein
LLFGPDGAAMSPTHIRKAGRLYRYYISLTAINRGAAACPVKQIPAAEIERIVIEQIRSLLQTPEVIVQTWRAARAANKALAASEVRSALLDFEPIWNELFPAEQARILELLVERAFGRPTLSKDSRTMTVHIPITLRHQDGRKQLVTPPGATPWIPIPSRVDSAIVKAIVRAHRWRDMLESGRHATVRDLAKAERIKRILPRSHPASYVALSEHYRSHP